ncbi:hypothetical protein [Roseateles toxinivorans]|uniref:Uncharacterized protein n=1 Tax=Roseateles toxinivorans TaxID=270368 RepID=A0A4V3CSU7_9BURK|nr:hypothetical protein [Roseateles toxinivorans]TDP62034.1 hypothetical protein DES47_10914 [Roseateles toxinivorans]
MEIIVGIALALLVYGTTHWLEMDRERVFYPTVMIAITTYYIVFAVIDGRGQVLLPEVVIAAAFCAVAAAGFKRNLWLVVVALAGHGVMDSFHHLLVPNTGVPQVWPGFCMAYDVTAAALLAYLLRRRARALSQPSGQLSADMDLR